MSTKIVETNSLSIRLELIKMILAAEVACHICTRDIKELNRIAALDTTDFFKLPRGCVSMKSFLNAVFDCGGTEVKVAVIPCDTDSWLKPCQEFAEDEDEFSKTNLKVIVEFLGLYGLQQVLQPHQVEIFTAIAALVVAMNTKLQHLPIYELLSTPAQRAEALAVQQKEARAQARALKKQK